VNALERDGVPVENGARARPSLQQASAVSGDAADPAVPVDVAIVGAGTIGACIALECARAGATVLVLDAGDGWGVGCSLGNAGWICPSHAGPFATSDDLANAVRWTFKRDSPFGVRLSPALIPWLARLLRFTLDRAHVRRVTSALHDLALESRALHAAYAASGVETGYEQRGLLDVYRTAAAFRAVSNCEGALGEAEARAAEPLLEGPVAGAVLHPDDAHCDPVRFVQAVGRAAEDAGAALHAVRRVTSVRRHASGAELDVGGEAVRARTVVVATGAQTRTLIPQIPIVSGAGYSLDLTPEDAAMPSRPIFLHEARIAITPLSSTLRMAGTMVIGRDPRPDVDRRRLDAIHRAGVAALPAWAGSRRSAGWAGARPCTYDGLPTIGRHGDVIVASGHGMLGVTLAPATAALLAPLVLEGRLAPELAPFDPARWL
jgi:D-amino-acid dehydrogenase